MTDRRRDLWELVALWMEQSVKLREAGSIGAADLLVQCATELQERLQLF
jgi:hypothetical protein